MKSGRKQDAGNSGEQRNLKKGGKRRGKIQTEEFVGSVASSAYAVSSQAISLNSTQGQNIGNRRKEKEMR